MTDKQNPQHVNWEAVWEQLNWDDEAQRQEVTRKRLQQRARQYGTPVQEVTSVGDTHSILAFRLGTEMYGVDVMVAQGIRALGRITRVPGTPRFYRGVVNIRGQIISVLDLRLFFNVAFDEQDTPRELVIVRANQLEIGLLAHHVEGLLTIPRETIEPLEAVQYALGVTPDRLVVLDILPMFADERLIIGGGEES